MNKEWKMTFRWYGENDSVTLDKIRQIPNMSGVVSAIYSVPVGEVWTKESLLSLKSQCEKHGLELEVIESIPVSEDIKMGKPTRDKLIDNYCESIRNVASIGVKCVCYNFMPVFDWLRTSLNMPNEDGSTSLAYVDEQMAKLDPKRLSLPGWDESYTVEQISALLEEYKTISKAQLFDNLVYFLERVIPVCSTVGVNLAIHPDDPPWDIFGLPRIISSEADLDKLFSAVPSKANGLTFCTGSLGAGRQNDLEKMAKKYASAGRIHFAHLRNIKYNGEISFSEASHYSKSGSLDMYKIVKALVVGGFCGYVRPDHGRNIWSESGKPGYGLYDRALGSAYLNGLFEAVIASEKREN